MTATSARLILFVACLASLVSPAHARPPAKANRALANWFRSLKAPNGSGCCSEADCRRVDARLTPAGYEVMIDDRWIAVPWERVLRHTSNPTGQAVACVVPNTDLVLCFVRPPDM